MAIARKGVDSTEENLTDWYRFLFGERRVTPSNWKAVAFYGIRKDAKLAVETLKEKVTIEELRDELFTDTFACVPCYCVAHLMVGTSVSGTKTTLATWIDLVQDGLPEPEIISWEYREVEDEFLASIFILYASMIF